MSTAWHDFRPQRQLLNSNFDGYRLSLDPLAQYHLKFDDFLQVQKDYELEQDNYTFNSIKGFKSLNQLVKNPWSNDEHLYFIDQNHAIQQIDVSSNQSLSHLQQPIAVYQLANPTLYGSMMFINEKHVCVCDGRSTITILNTETTKWKVVFEQDFDEYVHSPIRLLHAIEFEGAIHIVLGCIQTDCQLTWLTLSSNELKLIRRRTLIGKKWPDFVCLESNGQGIYIVAEGVYKFTFDSVSEVKQPEELPKKSVLEKIPSSLQYIWSQTHCTIDLEIDTPSSNDQQEFSVQIDSDRVRCSLGSEVLIDAQVLHSIDAKESSYSIVKDKTSQLSISLQKTKHGLFWNEVFESGRSIDGQVKLVDFTETDEDIKQPYNNQQLEECDEYTNENETFLTRFHGDTHQITHQGIIPNQILFTTLNPPSLCIRHDVDGLIWHLHTISSDNEQTPWIHEATLNAFGYVQASKQNRKFLSIPSDYSYALISDLQTHLYLYKQSTPTVDSSLRNRKSGQIVSNIAKQHMISLENHQDILGLITTHERIYILLSNQLSTIVI